LDEPFILADKKPEPNSIPLQAGIDSMAFAILEGSFS
jgi:hypothetical protein